MVILDGMSWHNGDSTKLFSFDETGLDEMPCTHKTGCYTQLALLRMLVYFL